MSKNKDINLADKESKSSQIIIISKGRLSSAKNNFSFITLQEGQRKLTIKLKNETLSKNSINQAVSSIKRDMLLRNSRSYSKLENNNKKLEKNINTLNGKSSKENIIKTIKLKSILSLETTKSLNMITTGNNKQDIISKNENEIKIKTKDLISNKESKDINNFIDFNNQVNEEITININDGKDEDSNNIESNTHSNNSRKVISQNYLNNIINNSRKLKIDSISKHKSEENKMPNSGRIKEENETKRNENYGNIQRSEKTTKSIMGSMIGYGSLDNRESNKENNYLNINRLMTENEGEIKSAGGDGSIKSKDELISNSKSRKIDENDEGEEDEYDEVEDEYDEKIVNDNNRKVINSMNILNMNKLKNAGNGDDNKKNELKNEFNDDTKNNNDDRVIKSLYLSTNYITDNIYTMCSICEHTYNISKLFVAECEEHFLCKRCTKNYYEEKIEDGITEICCPFLKCKAKVNLSKLKNIIGPDHYKRLINKNYNSIGDNEEYKNSLIFTKLKTYYNKGNAAQYSKKNVIDINSNKNFFNYNRIKDGYCPFCNEESLFSKTNSHYSKCLYCLEKICRYCYKLYNEKHMDIHSKDYCKVYYRLDDDKIQKNKFHIYLGQLFFVLSCFYLTFAGSFYIFKKMFFYLFNANNNKNFVKSILGYFFAMILFIISIPILVLLYPYFPSILAMSDY